jgi:hypothetical protein
MSRAVFLTILHFAGVKNAGEAHGGMQESCVRGEKLGQSFVKDLDQTFDGHQALLL